MKVKKQNIMVAFVCVLIAFSSCCTMKQIAPPYLITNQTVKVCENRGYHTFAGAYITFYNNSNMTVKKCSLSFRLYDSDGTAVGLGSNLVTSDYLGEIAPHEKADIIVSLDTVLEAAAQDAYQLDFVYAASITYNDGSVWTDPVGMFAW